MRADAVGVMIIPLVVCKVYLKRASRFLSSASIEDPAVVGVARPRAPCKTRTRPKLQALLARAVQDGPSRPLSGSLIYHEMLPFMPAGQLAHSRVALS